MRAPAVSGRFYPGERAALERAVRDLLADVGPVDVAPARAAVAPHAGYSYSGVTAAHVFARLALPRVVVVIAPNHTGVCRAPGGASLWEAGAFRTPLGDTPIDATLAAARRSYEGRRIIAAFQPHRLARVSALSLLHLVVRPEPDVPVLTRESESGRGDGDGYRLAARPGALTPSLSGA